MNFMRLSCVLSLVLCVGLQGAARIPNKEKLRWLMGAIAADDDVYTLSILEEDWQGMPKKRGISKKKQVAALLDMQVSLSENDRLSMTPLHYAVRRMKFDVVERLLQLGASVNSNKSFNRFTPGMIAALHYVDRDIKDVERMLELLQNAGMDETSRKLHGSLSVGDIVYSSLDTRLKMAKRREEQFADAEGDSWSYSTAPSTSSGTAPLSSASDLGRPFVYDASTDSESEASDEPATSRLGFVIRDIRKVAQCYERYSDELDPSSIEGMLARLIRNQNMVARSAEDVMHELQSKGVPRSAPIRLGERKVFEKRYGITDLYIPSRSTAVADIDMLGQEDAHERKKRKLNL